MIENVITWVETIFMGKREKKIFLEKKDLNKKFPVTFYNFSYENERMRDVYKIKFGEIRIKVEGDKFEPMIREYGEGNSRSLFSVLTSLTYTESFFLKFKATYESKDEAIKSIEKYRGIIDKKFQEAVKEYRDKEEAYYIDL